MLLGGPWSAQRARAHPPAGRALRMHATLAVLYHKTGFALTVDLATWLNELGLYTPKFVHTRACMNGTFPQMRTCHSGRPKLVRLETPTFSCGSLLDSLPRCFRVLHFVRDPATVFRSGYEYHRQSSTPENWVHRNFKQSSFCSGAVPTYSSSGVDADAPSDVHHNFLPFYANFLAAATALGVTQDELLAAQATCRSLPLAEDLSLYEHLRRLPAAHGLKLAAFHQLAVMLTMGANALVLQRRRWAVCTLWLDGVMARPSESFRRMTGFLHELDGRAELGERRARNASIAQLSDSLTASFHKSISEQLRGQSVSELPSSPSHITSVGRADEGQHQEALQRVLEGDPAIAPLLARIRRALAAADDGCA